MKKAFGILLVLLCGLAGAREWTPITLPEQIPSKDTIAGDTIALAMDSSDRGTGFVFIPEGYIPSRKGMDILVHLHTAPWLIRQEFLKTGKKAVIVTVQYPGLSAAYSGPFSRNTVLFSNILQQTVSIVTAKYPGSKPKIRRLAVSSFSAGYGAVREILKQPENYQQIQEVLLIDSLHTSIKDTTSRELETEYLYPFVKLAKDAAKGKKTFISTHSAIIPNNYAGTPETNQYLIKQVGGITKMVIKDADKVINTSGKIWLACDKRGFHVRGYSGIKAESHMSQVYAVQYWFQALKVDLD